MSLMERAVPRSVPPASLARRAAIAALIGTATAFGQTVLTGTWQALPNSAGPWLLGAFAAGALQSRSGLGVVAGLGCCLPAADVFDQRDEDGIAVLLNENPPAEVADDVRQAAAVCPAPAIRIEE